MNPMKFFWGLVFTGIGVLLLGANLGWWSTNVWEVLWYLWPLIIIVVGLRFIVNNDKLFMVLALIIVLASGYLIVKEPEGVLKKLGARLKETTETYSEGFSPSEVEELVLKFNLGASKVNFLSLNADESKNSLYDVVAKNYGIVIPNKKVDGKKTTVEFSESPVDANTFRRINRRELSAKFSQIPALVLDINTGASKFEADLTGLKLKKIDFKSGASDIEVRFDKLVDLLEANFDMGASSVEVEVPDGVGVKVDFESEEGLNNFRPSDDLKLVKSDHTYKSEDYDSATKKINIRISAGASDFRINQY